jgi:uncharacterized RDD family membrane protein YckC
MLAFVLDVGLIALAVSLTVWFFTRERWKLFTWPTDEESSASLHHIELLVWWYLSEGASPFDRVWLLTHFLQPSLDTLPINGGTGWIAFAAFAAIYLAKLVVESVSGITPGKWLMGLRTVSSTGRRAGLAPVLVRDLLLWFDFPLFISALPAAISMFLSPQRQRLGDRLADTIVVKTCCARGERPLR